MAWFSPLPVSGHVVEVEGLRKFWKAFSALQSTDLSYGSVVLCAMESFIFLSSLIFRGYFIEDGAL